MASRIRVSRNFTMAVPRCIRPETARTIGLWLLVQIENRTISGLNETRSSFAPYSARYGKEVKGRMRPVDLKRSGDMLGDMDVVAATSHRIALGFNSDAMAQRAAYHDSLASRRKMPLRRFLGVQQSWIEEVVKRLREGMTF